MPIFRSPDDFKDHKSYVTLLKKALLQVKGETPKKFLYFKLYSFGGKKLPLVLVDHDLNCVGLLNKAGVKPTDEGLVSLTPQDELNFEPKKGALKRIRLKKYFATMGSGIKPVFVPVGEVDEEGEESESEGESPPKTSATAPPVPPPPAPTEPPPTAPEPPVAPPEPPRDLELEKKQAQLRERLNRLGAQVVPPPLDQMKPQVLKKATALAAAGRCADANVLLDQYEKRIATPITPKPPGAAKPPSPTPPSKPPPPPPAQSPPAPPPKAGPSETEVPKERKLSTYLGLNTEWDNARKQAAQELQRLEKVIAAACDGEPVKDLVFKKLPQLHTLVLKLDARLSEALSAGAKATDPDKQLDLDKATRKLVVEYRGTLRGHPLAAVVDENPFGSFRVMQPLETALAKIETEFN